jgi:hypothetical protein
MQGLLSLPYLKADLVDVGAVGRSPNRHKDEAEADFGQKSSIEAMRPKMKTENF